MLAVSLCENNVTQILPYREKKKFATMSQVFYFLLLLFFLGLHRTMELGIETLKGICLWIE